MANLFLDANICLRLREGKLTAESKYFEQHKLFVSGLSIHIACYVHKITIPDQEITDFFSFFTVLPLSAAAFQKSFSSPTQDYEDNLQLNSALEIHADFFVTLDKALLKREKIERMRIISPADLIEM